MAGKPAKIGPQAIRYALLNVGGEALHALAGESWREFLASIVNLRGLDLAEETLSVGSVLFLAIWILFQRARPEVGISVRIRAYALLLLWALVTILFFLRHSTPVYSTRPHT